MIFLPLLVLITIGWVIAAVLRHVLRGEERSEEEGLLGRSGPSVLTIAIGGGLVLLLLLFSFGLPAMRGVRGDGPHPDAPEADRATVEEEAVAPPTPRTVDSLEPDVELHAAFEESLSERPVLGELAAGDVVVVRGVGFPGDSTGGIVTCTPRCGEEFPVRFDGDGNALVQYELDAAVVRGCTDKCYVELRSIDVRATAGLVFGAPVPRSPVVRVSPATRLRDGDRVEVTVAGVRRGVDAVACPREAVEVRECTARAEVGESLVVGRGTGKIVVLDGDGGGALAAPVYVDVARGPGPRYAPARLAIGLAIALVLLAMATWLVRTADWHPPPEAEVPA